MVNDKMSPNTGEPLLTPIQPPFKLSSQFSRIVLKLVTYSEEDAAPLNE